MGKTLDELKQIGKGVLSYGKDALNVIQESDDFKSFNQGMNEAVTQVEAKGKEIKDNLMSKGQEYDAQKNANNTNEANQNNNTNNQ